MAFFDQDLFASSVANKDYARATGANAAASQAVAANRQAGAAETSAAGRANLDNATAGQIPANSAATRALQGAQGGYYGAEAYRANQEGDQVAPNAASLRSLQSQQGGFYGAQTRSLDDLGGIDGHSKGATSIQDRPATPAEMHFFHQHLLAAKQGATKVPGKGPSTVDTVPAMLAPREAVLNEHAADLIGRDKIAAANAIGVAHQKAQGKGMVSSRPAQPKPQKMSGGTHMVGHGKSAKTPTKIDPQALLSLMGAMQGGQAGGPPQAPMQGPGGMV